MNKHTLQKELKNLKHYLKQIGKIDSNINKDEEKIISHTLVGMIMTIHNLLKTGAYNLDNEENDELLKLVDEARNTAIHYGYFNDLDNIYPQAQKIVSSINTSPVLYFADKISSMTYNENCDYYQIFHNDKTQIEQIFTPDNLIMFKNLKSNETLYIKKEDVIIVKNKLNNNLSYLIKASNENDFFFKESDDSTTIKTNFYDLSQNKFFLSFKMLNIANRVGLTIQKLLNEIKTNPYKNTIIKYKYDNKSIGATIYNVLKDLLYNQTIEEKILFGNFIMDSSLEFKTTDANKKDKIVIKNLVNDASINDFFFMELFLKRYQRYSRLDEKGSLNLYSEQSILTNLFEVGVAYLSEKFLKSDKSGYLISLFHNLRNIRNELAHTVPSCIQQKGEWIEIAKANTKELYEIILKVYELYCLEKAKSPTTSCLKRQIKIGKTHSLVNNKTSRYAKLKHTGICKIINGKKYLGLEGEKKHTYVEIDRSILSLNYNTLTSNECAIPLDAPCFVEIDCNTNKVKPTNYKISQDEIINIDPYLQTLMQAHDIFKTYPQYKKKSLSNFSVITFYDKFGTAIYTEGVKNLLYRRYAQKIIPSQLLEASTLVVPNDIDEPLTILNKNKVMIAKVYLACINNINGKEVVTQILKNKQQKQIQFGKFLPKDLRTSEVITVIKEGRK